MKIDISRHIYWMYFAATILSDLMDYASDNSVDVRPLDRIVDNLENQKYVSYEAMVKTLIHIGKELNDDYLGLHIGEQISLKATAKVDSIMLHSATLEESINNAIVYSKLISDALTCSFEKTKRYYSVVYEENPDWEVHHDYARRQIMDITLLSNVKSLAAYTNYRYFPVYINFHYPRPKSLHEYYRLFNCSLRFNQTKTEIVYERQIMDRHSKKIELGLLENLKQKVAREIERLPSENATIYQLKKYILSQKPRRILIEEAARDLNMSKRTLQRKLKGLDTTFKKTESGIQLNLARTYLIENKKSIDEISYLLGFSESSAFIRFFRSMTGQTPLGYRKGTS